MITLDLGLPKSTIYYHIRKVFGRKLPQVNFDHTPSAGLGEFLGLFATDGSFFVDRQRYQYTLTITLSRSQVRYAQLVQRMIEGVIGKKPRIDTKQNCVQLVTRRKAILGFLKKYLAWEGRKTYSIRFRETALGLSVEFARGVLRGLIAGDGNVYPPKHRIAFGVVSKRLAEQYSGLLEMFGIASHTYVVHYKDKKSLYHVHVTGRRNLEKFKLRVGLTDPARGEQLDSALRP